jgi:hypothetical protein
MNAIDTQLDQEVKEMKKVFWALGLTLVFNLAGVAQNQKKSPKTDETTDQKVSRKNNNSKGANSGESFASFSTVSNLQAELQNTLDVRKAKVGDQVILKTTQSVKQDGEVVIPKGTNLIGRVTEVQQKTKNGAASKLSLVFDRLQGREISTPITASIVSITNATAASSVGDAIGSDVSGSSMTSTRASTGSSGGGLLGGVTNTVGGVVNTATQTVGGVTDTATRTVGGTTQTLGRTINGIQISSSASGSAQSSTTLSSPNNNIRLDKGVTFSLNVQKPGGN